MKVFKIAFLMLFAVSLVMTSCKNEKDAASMDVTPATTETTATPVKPDAVKNQPDVPKGPATTIKFDEESFDFGEIKDGDKVRHVFSFTNTGDNPLIISNCKGSCGCTAPNCPKDPIAPGAKGEITVEYNSKNKGAVGGKVDQKFVTVTANTTPEQSRLTIKAKVVKDAAAEVDAKK